MKYLLLSTLFLLVLVSCKKEEENPQRVVFELGKCFNGTVPGNFTMEHDDSNFDTNLYCGKIFAETHFPLSDKACEWISNYCCEENKEFPYVNELGERIFLSIENRSPVLMKAPTSIPCENQPDKKTTYYHYFEMARVYLKSSLSEQSIVLNIWPSFEDILSDTPKLGSRMDIYNYLERTEISSPLDIPHNNIENRSYRFPADWINLTKPFPYEYQYLPEIEILDKTFFEVYTHEEDLKGFYTKIYYNKEYGIVSFVDATGMQWRVDW